ncbi:N-acyltransferase YncA [compost metagenome]
MHKGNVYGLYVALEHRGEGLGRRLLEQLISKAKQCDGLEQINLTVISNNAAAKKLYEAAGFVCYGTEPNACKLGDQYWDDDLMVLKLK